MHKEIEGNKFIENCIQVDTFNVYVHPYSEFISNEIRLYSGYESGYISVITSYINPGDTVIDIGANIGIHSLHYSKAVGDNGNVFAFEPDPENLELLKINIEKNHCKNVKIFPFALGNNNDTCNLYLNKRNKGKQSFADLDKLGNPIKIIVKRLEEIPGIKDISLAKMDVEGAEPLVFEGFGNIRPKYIFFEFTIKQLQALDQEPLRFLNTLIRNKYNLYLVKGNLQIPISAEEMVKEAESTHKDYNLLAKI